MWHKLHVMCLTPGMSLCMLCNYSRQCSRQHAVIMCLTIILWRNAEDWCMAQWRSKDTADAYTLCVYYWFSSAFSTPDEMWQHRSVMASFEKLPFSQRISTFSIIKITYNFLPSQTTTCTMQSWLNRSRIWIPCVRSNWGAWEISPIYKWTSRIQ